MISVNLLPEATVRKQRANRRARIWLVLTLCAAAGAAVPVGVTVTRQAQASTLQQRCREVDRERSKVQAQLAATLQEVERLATHFAQSETLRTKRSWASLIGFIGGSMPPEVWLTAIATDPPFPMGRGRTEVHAEPGDTVVLEAPTKLLVQGYALDHKDLYAFMSRLKQADVFTGVELMRSGREPVLAGQAVRFDLQCSW